MSPSVQPFDVAWGNRTRKALRGMGTIVTLIGISLALFWPAKGQPPCGIGHEFNQCGGTADYRLGLRLGSGLGAIVLGGALILAARGPRLRRESESSIG
jgi:hypothetical protein